MTTELDVLEWSMNDVRVTHDRSGSYADWFGNQQIDLPELIKRHDYTIGKTKPNYPMPAIRLVVSLRSGSTYDATNKTWIR